MSDFMQFIFPNEKYDDINSLKFDAHIIDNHIYFVEYNDVISSIIKYAKYTHHPASFVLIGKKIAQILKKTNLTADLITYVPMHFKAQKKRGFNQSMILAKEISKTTGIPICHEALRKIKQTCNQASLNASMRLVNLKGVFFADDRYTAGRRIIIVDDIYTTGTTLNECRNALIESMADSVIYLTITKRNI